MNKEDREFVENLLKQTMYSITNQFISTEITEDVENESTLQKKNATLEKAHEIINKEVPKIVDRLEKVGIAKLSDFNENQEVVSELLGKLENKMRKNAEDLSKK